MPAVTLSKAARHISELVGYRIAPSTLRSWCNVTSFQPFLSDDATPDPGVTRLLTPHDIQVMTRIAEYRRQNLSYDEIADRLATPPEQPTPQPQPADELVTDQPHDAADEHHAPIVAGDVPTYLAALATRQDDHIQRQDDRIRQLEDSVRRIDNHTRLIVAAVAGVVAGAVIVGILAALVMLR